MVIEAKNWKEAEDTTRVRAWMAIAQDLVMGNEQRTEHSWDRVHAVFSRSFDDVRKNEACKFRWQLLQKAVSKFSDCWAAIQTRSDSGATIPQKLFDKHTLYLQDSGKPFKHVTC
uniref:AlNc14C170G7970 protein n=1 Tax=Albugo laibachii Nc14 TaxID=890382 RepID=F0WNE3_9STRA|nr:AlNc14C170G7970 [Albugo laibachii Nc14]|eukprot:CCA22834.1 AlNc14C170G7970 [Albugo laibachii Nc14]